MERDGKGATSGIEVVARTAVRFRGGVQRGDREEGETQDDKTRHRHRMYQGRATQAKGFFWRVKVNRRPRQGGVYMVTQKELCTSSLGHTVV